jgi:flagella basal body P-ring formation protein FlgA
MKNFTFLAVLFLSLAAHAQDNALPAILPDSPDSLSAMDDAFPKEFQLASNEDAAVFEFPKIVMPAEVKKPAQNAENWEEQIRGALVAKGAGDKIAIDGIRYGRNVKDALTDAAKWQAQDIVFDAKTSRFSGKLVAEGQPAITFRGRYGAMQLIPVFTKRMEKGMLISESDITIKPILSMRASNSKTLQKPEQIIGKTLKRAIASGQPIRVNDITEQLAVLANSEVEMVYKTNGIVVTDRGIAMEKGAVGDVIRVKNIKSGATLRAKVDAPNRVSVNYFEAAPLAMVGEENAQN